MNKNKEVTVSLIIYSCQRKSNADKNMYFSKHMYYLNI